MAKPLKMNEIKIAFVIARKACRYDPRANQPQESSYPARGEPFLDRKSNNAFHSFGRAGVGVWSGFAKTRNFLPAVVQFLDLSAPYFLFATKVVRSIDEFEPR